MTYGRVGTQILCSNVHVHPILKSSAKKLKVAAGIPMATLLQMDMSGLATTWLSVPVAMER